MLQAEFTQRTKYTPSDLEYHYIEESYYDFDGGKDEFCKAWLKDKKNGKWEQEMKLREKIADQKFYYEAELAYERDRLDYYEMAYRVLEKRLRELGEKPFTLILEAQEKEAAK